MTAGLSIALLAFTFTALVVAYVIGKRHGWEDAHAAFREQRSPLPAITETDR